MQSDLRCYVIQIDDVITQLIEQDLEEGKSIYLKQFEKSKSYFEYRDKRRMQIAMKCAKELVKYGDTSIFKRLCLHYHYQSSQIIEAITDKSILEQIESTLNDFYQDILDLKEKTQLT